MPLEFKTNSIHRLFQFSFSQMSPRELSISDSQKSLFCLCHISNSKRTYLPQQIFKNVFNRTISIICQKMLFLDKVNLMKLIGSKCIQLIIVKYFKWFFSNLVLINYWPNASWKTLDVYMVQSMCVGKIWRSKCTQSKWTRVFVCFNIF